MARQPAHGDEDAPVVTDEPDAESDVTGDEVPVPDALDQSREVLPTEHFDPPSLAGDVSEFDALEQARGVGLDEDDDGYDQR